MRKKCTKVARRPIVARFVARIRKRINHSPELTVDPAILLSKITR
jgi:hypothetical protein